MKSLFRLSIILIWLSSPALALPVSAAELIVDERDSGFTKGGSYWQDDWARGYAGHMFWTCVNGSVTDSWAEWRPNLAGAGSYEVLAYIPDYHTNTSNAAYEIHHRDGVTTVRVAQSPFSNTWLSLGSFNFNAGSSGYVRLTDATGEPASCTTQIGFDAMKWVGGTTASDCAQFVSDLTIPDGTLMTPAQAFEKRWRLKNCGNTDWSGFQAVRTDGSFGPASFNVSGAAGQTVDLGASMTAPTSPGSYRATYRLQGPRGPFGDPFWVEVVVQQPASDCAQFVSDLTIPDGTLMTPAQAFEKRWRLKNCGNTDWSGFQAIRTDGSFGSASFNVSGAAGQTVDLGASIIAPTSPGSYRATYRLQGPRGQFGDPFWVEVVVQQPASDCAQFVSDLTIPDGTLMTPGQAFEKRWRLKNCGNTDWSGFQAVRTDGSFGPASFNVSGAVGQTVDLGASITAPTSPGSYRATYRLQGPRGPFGDPFWVEVVVRTDNGGTNPGDYALLAPVSAGQKLTIIHGYNDPLPNENCKIGTGPDHCANQRYGLDIVPSRTEDRNIIAPLPGTIAWTAGDCLGIRTRDNLNLNICHFSSFVVHDGQNIERGASLGVRSTDWIHLSLDDRYNNASKPPIPFSGVHSLEGQNFEAPANPSDSASRNLHNLKTFVSTNGDVVQYDCMRFAGDANYPDGTQVNAGASFDKRWWLTNCGNTSWDTNFRAVRISGNYGPASFPISSNPDETKESGASFTAPSSPGTHRATYRLEGPRGQFGPEFFVEIVVGTAPGSCQDRATLVSETIPDGTSMTASQEFEKTWKIRNTGSCSWDSSYRLIFRDGTRLSAINSIALPNLAAGAEADIRLMMTAPAAPGTYRGVYNLVNRSGIAFSLIWVDIVVPNTNENQLILGNPPPDYFGSYWNSFDQDIVSAAAQYNLPPALVKAVIAHESGGLAKNGGNPTRAFLYEGYSVDYALLQPRLANGTRDSRMLPYLLPDHPPAAQDMPYSVFTERQYSIPAGTTARAMGTNYGPITDNSAGYGVGRIPLQDDFLAQYRLASSYGLGQIVYYFHANLIDFGAPETLYDPKVSIDRSCQVLSNKRNGLAPQLGATSTNFDDWTQVLLAYNGGGNAQYPGYVRYYYTYTQPLSGIQSITPSTTASVTQSAAVPQATQQSSSPYQSLLAANELILDSLIADLTGTNRQQLIIFYTRTDSATGAIRIFNNADGSQLVWESQPITLNTAYAQLELRHVSSNSPAVLFARWANGPHSQQIQAIRWNATDFQVLPMIDAQQGTSVDTIAGDAGILIGDDLTLRVQQRGEEALYTRNIQRYRYSGQSFVLADAVQTDQRPDLSLTLLKSDTQSIPGTLVLTLQLSNQGAMDAQDFYVGHATKGGQYVSELPAATSMQIQLHYPLLSGSFNITADLHQQISEASEANNTLTVQGQAGWTVYVPVVGR